MKRTHTIALGISAVALGIGGLATAQGAMHHGGGRAGAMMKALDANNDGTITRAEAQAGAATMFARMDVNKDGKLDQADREQGRAMMRDEMFKTLDADGNGSISRAEFDAHHDRDGGPGGPGEKGGPGMMPPPPGGPMSDADGPGGHREHGGKGGHGRMGGHRGGPGGGMMAMAKMADTNNDGAISQAEFGTTALKHFDMADANHDGKITEAEQKAARETMKAQMKAKWQADKPAGN